MLTSFGAANEWSYHQWHADTSWNDPWLRPGVHFESSPTQREKPIMSTTEAASKIFEEVAQLFASAPSDEQILSFRPPVEVARRASELLILNRSGQADEDLRHELDQYEQAELLMRMVKARIRARRESLERLWASTCQQNFAGWSANGPVIGASIAWSMRTMHSCRMSRTTSLQSSIGEIQPKGIWHGPASSAIEEKVVTLLLSMKQRERLSDSITQG